MIIKKRKLCRTTATNAYDLLTDVANVVECKPGNYYQGAWKAEADRVFEEVPKNACGTTCCVAGFIDELVSKKPIKVNSDFDEKEEIMPIAKKILGLSDLDAWVLFDEDAVHNQWMKEGGDYDDCPQAGTPEYSALGARHIRRFRDKHKAQLKKKKITV